ncbi:MAG: radical SAM protein [Saprospiraceae bacterium]|nr:radical SAM protein [Saprospiraceae bacterium]
MKHYTIPIFIPELACPHQCVFCNQRKISGHQKSPTLNEVKTIIEEHLATIPQENSHIEIGFFGGNFTGIEIDEQENYLKTVQPYLKERIIKGIRLSTRPDYINQEILNLLKKYKVSTIELGAQSMDEDVLVKSGRGHTIDDVVQASKLIVNNGFSLGLQMMIGLPGDSLEKSINTAKKIIELKADNTRIYPTLVIKGTKLEELYKEGLYKPLSIKEAVNWSKELFLMFEKANVNIIRMGLHPSEGIIGDDFVDGPFHQSFKELVLTEMWNDLFKQKFNKKIAKDISISVSPSQLNYAIGYKAKNKVYLQQFFRKVEFKIDSSLTGRNMKIEKK